MKALFFILLVWTSGCGEVLETEHESRIQAIGEPFGDFPSYNERLLLYLTNQRRTEPDAFNPNDPYDPSPPVRYDPALGRAARFQSQHIIDASCWCEDHSSCCELESVENSAQCSGPTLGCGVTAAADRISMFSPSWSGENMALGQTSPLQAVEAWTFSPGHWRNINGPDHRTLGTGSFDNAWVQVFGGAGGPTAVADGIHWRSGSRTHFGSTYFQADTGGPQTALVIVEGECLELDLVNGTPELGAFETSTTLEAGCHRYYFHFTDGNGNDITYPSRGSFGVGIQAECEFFIEERPADTCSPSGQTCETGDTRSCYTGAFGTRNVGACSEGIERCIGGSWTGDCMGQTTPAEEVCDSSDADCDGSVDEGCAEEPAPQPDPMDNPNKPPVSQDEKSDPDSGCATAEGKGLWMFSFMVITALTRRRVRPGMRIR